MKQRRVPESCNYQRFGSSWHKRGEKYVLQVVWMFCTVLQSWLEMVFLWFKNRRHGQTAVMHTFNPSTREAEAGRSL